MLDGVVPRPRSWLRIRLIFRGELGFLLGARLGWVVVKVSGKIVNPGQPRLVRGYAELLSKVSRDKRLVVVVGGGGVARSYIEAARTLGLSRGLQDMLGIEAARLNARLLAYALGSKHACLHIPRSVGELLEAASYCRVVLLGGFQPGQSTAAVAAITAELLSAEKLVLATTVDGVYDRDPRRYPGAKLLSRLTYAELEKVLEQSVEPGRYELLDPQAIRVLERSCIETVVVNGLDPKNVEKAISGEPIGTIVTC